MTHTSGPWTAERLEIDQFSHGSGHYTKPADVMTIFGADGETVVCEVQSDHDGHIIAAGPDVVAALKLLLDYQGTVTKKAKPDDQREWFRRLAIARRAMEKAEGRETSASGDSSGKVVSRDISREGLSATRPDSDALLKALRPFVESYCRDAEPIGDSDLYDEQPRSVSVTLGDCRRASALLGIHPKVKE